ncbi:MULTISPECIES: hypothetical protein [unclassified Paraflavitalea]|uniref:hypothetical protein n=1 Tax=unclassified Paraflavitalea TaxID=2798305 RepID=UPI003D3426CC
MMKALKGAVNQAKGFFDNYKAPFLLLFLLVACATTYGQVDTTKTLQRINALGYQYKNIGVDSSFMIPQDTFKLRYADSSGIAIKKGVMYRWTGTKWVAIARKLTDSTIVFNGDTLKISGTVSGGSSGVSSATVVDTVTYIHSGSSIDTLTFSELIGKTVISANLHPYSLYLVSTTPSADQVRVNSITGGVKFGTPINTGQQFTLVYIYSSSSGSPVVSGIKVNSGATQTGIVDVTIPAQFNPIAGTGVTLIGSYPNITFNASGSGGSAAQTFDTDTATSIALVGGHIRPSYSAGTNTWSFIEDAQHSRINLTTIDAKSSFVTVKFKNTYSKIVNFGVNHDETVSKTAVITGGTTYNDGPYLFGARIFNDSADIYIYKQKSYSFLVSWNGTAWTTSPQFGSAIDPASPAISISWSAGRLRMQNISRNIVGIPTIIAYSPNGVTTSGAYIPMLDRISNTFIDIYFYDVAGHAAYTATTPPTGFGFFIDFGPAWTPVNPQTEDFGASANMEIFGMFRK